MHVIFKYMHTALLCAHFHVSAPVPHFVGSQEPSSKSAKVGQLLTFKFTHGMTAPREAESAPRLNLASNKTLVKLSPQAVLLSSVIKFSQFCYKVVKMLRIFFNNLSFSKIFNFETYTVTKISQISPCQESNDKKI